MAIMTALALVPPILEGDTTARRRRQHVVDRLLLGAAVHGARSRDPLHGQVPRLVRRRVRRFACRSGQDAAPDPDARPTTTTCRAGDAVLDATPQQALVDEPIAVTMLGLAPGSRSRCTATNVDLAGNVWRSTTSFRAELGRDRHDERRTGRRRLRRGRPGRLDLVDALLHRGRDRPTSTCRRRAQSARRHRGGDRRGDAHQDARASQRRSRRVGARRPERRTWWAGCSFRPGTVRSPVSRCSGVRKAGSIPSTPTRRCSRRTASRR